MSYTMDYQKENDALIVTLKKDFDFKDEWGPLLGSILEKLDEIDSPAYYVSDVQEVSLSFSDAVQGLAQITRGQRLLRHPNIREILVVSEMPLIKFATDALGQDQYGKLRAQTFKSLDACLEYIKAEKVTE